MTLLGAWCSIDALPGWHQLLAGAERDQVPADRRQLNEVPGFAASASSTRHSAARRSRCAALKRIVPAPAASSQAPSDRRNMCETSCFGGRPGQSVYALATPFAVCSLTIMLQLDL